MQIDSIVRKEIDEFLEGNRINKEGQIYKLFNSELRKEDIRYLKNAFYKIYKGLVAFVGEENKREIAKQMLLTFERIQGVRIDETDADVQPVKTIIENMKSRHNGTLDTEGGVTRASWNDGIILLVPSLKTEIEHNRKNKNNRRIDGMQTLVHEVIHALSIWNSHDKFWVDGRFVGKKKVERFEYTFGVRRHKFAAGIFDDLNEGLTEWIAQKTIECIYQDSPLNNKIDYNRYPRRVYLADKILNVFDNNAKNDIIVKYLTGNGDEVLDAFKSIKNQNTNLVDFLIKHFYKQVLSIRDVRGSYEDEAIEMAILFEISHFIKRAAFLPQEGREL